MNLFGIREPDPGAPANGNTREIVERLDKALTAIFSEDGKRTVTYYLTNKYGVTLESASRDPSKLEHALTELLGEIGWTVVKKAILEEFWSKKIGMNETLVVERASLREAFGFVRGLGPGTLLRP
jgi:hypothetical protein